MRALCVLGALYALVGGAVSLAGWVFDLPRLTDWWQHGTPIEANTSLGVACAGMALLTILHYPSARLTLVGLALFTLLLGTATLLEYLMQTDFGIDTLLFDPAPDMTAMVRMGPPAAVSFVALGAALILLDGTPGLRGLGVGLAVSVVGIAALSLVGYWYGVEAMHALPQLTGISLQGATLLATLGVCAITAAPEREPVKTLCEDSSAGLLARQLLPVAFAVPLGLGWLRIQGFEQGLYGSTFGTALRTLLEIAILCAVAWWSVQAIRARERDQHQAEEALRAADRHKDEFLATLAHELRNPLAPIRNATALMMRTDAPESLRQRSAEIIGRQVQHMARLLEDLLDISRISRDRMELRRQPVELAQVVHNAVETSRPAIEGAGHQLTVELPDRALRVHGDPVRLAQVFSNLLNNAAKYTPPGGHIRISSRSTGGNVEIRVIDDGVGIDPGFLPQIFEMFSQAAPKQAGAGAGLGIGLSLARGIVERHGGRIRARSAGRGQGSEFAVQLSRLPDDVGEKRPQTPVPESQPCQRRILVIDDLQDSADTLATLLDTAGHQVRAVYSGDAALAAAEAFHPQVLFVDIGMPGMDGLHLCRRVRATDWGREAFLVALTGWGQLEDRRRTEAAGFDAHLIKPVDFEELLKLLREPRRSALPQP